MIGDCAWWRARVAQGREGALARMWQGTAAMNARSIVLPCLAVGWLLCVAACDSIVVQDIPDPDDNDPACPASDPVEATACEPDGIECAYDHEPDEECTYAYQCTAGLWALADKAGGGCEEPQCRAYPTCAPTEEEVASCAGFEPAQNACREVTMCGSTIYCASSTCAIAPYCDPGDVQVDGACPPDGSCYQAQECGVTIDCRDSALPQHGCPPAEPSEGAACDSGALGCDYDTGNGCFSSYACDGVWTWVGGGCEEGG